MSDASDMELVRQYAEYNSEPAFGELARRHVNLVHSVAMRFAANPADAQDITQAVFIILAQKAASLRSGTILTGWFYETTRFTALQYLRNRTRRQRRELEAYMTQSLLEQGGTDQVWRQVGPMLEDAMSRLSEKERTLLALRFFENRTGAETAALLGTGEWAARKRADRALEKLRKFFFRRGVDSTTAAIAETISSNSIRPAPAALAKMVTAVAVAKGATAPLSAAALAKATLLAMKIKMLIANAAIAAAVIVIGTGAFFLTQSKAKTASGADAAAPINLPNDTFVTANDYIESHAVIGQNPAISAAALLAYYADDRYINDVDSNTLRTANSPPAGHIKCLVAPATTGSADYLASLGTPGVKALQSGRYVRYEVGKDSPLLGKHVRITGWVKTKDIANWAGGSLAIVNADGHIFASDGMSGHPLHGTLDWTQIETITDVPDEPCTIYFGPMLYGTGELWMDGFQIAAASSDEPITDDRIWHVWSTNPNDYSETTDSDNRHDGHPTFCITYTPSGAAPKGSWMWWGEDIRTPVCNKFLGHTVRMTMWTKTEDVAGGLRPNLRPKGADFKLLARDRIIGGRINGTTDWTQRTIICQIPKDTQCLDTGFAFTGIGKVWIDLDSLIYENIDNPDKPKLIK